MARSIVNQSEAHVQRYWNVDGLHEIAIAILFGLTAACTWASNLSSLPRAGKGATTILFPILLWTGMWAEPRMVDAIRRRTTYPRAGFVVFRKPSWKRQWIGGSIALAFGAAIAVAVIRQPDVALNWLPAATGLFSATILILIGSGTGLPRFSVMGVLMAAIGAAISLSGVAFDAGLVLFFAAGGVVSLVSGSVALWRFLHSTPPAEA